MSESLSDDAQLSPVLVALFRGVLSQEQSPELWAQLLSLQGRVQDYVAVLGLDLQLDEGNGFAWLSQRSGDEGETALPRLVQRRPLSYPVSLLLALLRKKLLEHDANSGEPRLIMTREQIVEMLRLFIADSSNEARLVDRIDAHINKVVELGFLRRLRGDSNSFEVRRLIAAFVDGQWLSEFEQRLEAYRAHATGDEAGASEEP